MNKVSEERMKLRIDYSRETDLIFSDNIPAYADWLEQKLALSQPLVSGSFCKCKKLNYSYTVPVCNKCNSVVDFSAK